MQDFGNIDNVISGPALLYFDDGTGEREIGLTKGDIEYSIDPKYYDQNYHQYGETLVGKRMTGMSGMVKFSVAELTWENLQMSMPHATLYTDGSKKALGVGPRVGHQLLDDAGVLRIHPINELGTGGDDDPTYLDLDLKIWKAANAKGVTRKINSTEDQTIDVEMDMFVDTTKPANYSLFILGDPSVTTLDTTAPTVDTIKAEVSDTPTEITTSDLADVDTDSEIVIDFDEEINENMVNDIHIALIADADKSKVDVTLTHEVVEGDPNISRVTMVPDSALTNSAKYHVVIGGIKDVTGNWLVAPHMRTFTVVAA